MVSIDIQATYGHDPRENCAKLQTEAPGWTATFDACARRYVMRHPNFGGDRPQCGAAGLGLSVSGSTAAEVLARVAALPGILRVRA